MASSGIRMEREGVVTRITFTRPDASNAIDLPTAAAFAEAVAAAGDDGSSAILLTGDGPRFCAGGDLASMLASTHRAAYVHKLATVFGEALVALVCPGFRGVEIRWILMPR